MSRFLGLDVGKVRIGVARSDPLGLTAQPLEVIDRRKVNAVQRVSQLIEESDAEGLIVGYPLRLDGSEGPATKFVKDFVEKLRPVVEIPIELVDERLSTKQAQQVMLEAGARRKVRKNNIDKLAAALILQSYLDQRS